MDENNNNENNHEEIDPTPEEAPDAVPPVEPHDAVATAVPIGPTDEEVERQIRRISRRSFLWAGVAVVAGFEGWRWLIGRRSDDGVPWPFRRTLEVNEQLARDYFNPSRLAPTFPRSQAMEPKANGDYGLDNDIEPDTWRLRVIGLADTSQATMMKMPPPQTPNPSPKDMLAKDKKAGGSSGNGGSENPSSDMMPEEAAVELTLDDIKRLPRTEMVTELKCIEGWSTVVHWAGARFADFIAKYPPAKTDDKLPGYVGMETPDGGYYVGLDMESAMHPQTLLCYEMNGQPLTSDHGAPLRLVIPVKYGIKNIKRIGTIRFTDERPKDYWAMQGYDWYAGH